MAKPVKLKAEPRTNLGRSGVSKLRARGIIPAVIYGGKVKSQSLQIAARDINAMMSHASGENVLVDLEIAGENSNHSRRIAIKYRRFHSRTRHSIAVRRYGKGAS